jgi:hypothetical protein
MKDDMLVVIGKTELDRSAVELYIYQEISEATNAPNLYVHHDFELPAFPLSLATIDIDPRGTILALLACLPVTYIVCV